MNGKKIAIVSISALLSGLALGEESNSTGSQAEQQRKEEKRKDSNEGKNLLQTIEQMIEFLRFDGRPSDSTPPCIVA